MPKEFNRIIPGKLYVATKSICSYRSNPKHFPNDKQHIGLDVIYWICKNDIVLYSGVDTDADRYVCVKVLQGNEVLFLKFDKVLWENAFHYLLEEF